MPGSLDHGTVSVLSQDDYEYLLIRSDIVTVKFSPNTKIDRIGVIRELREIAKAMEAQLHA